jgi:hypothetical protein
MRKIIKQFRWNEKGQSLSIVLAILALGGLTIAASLNLTSSSLVGDKIIKREVDGIYAAGAGIEHTIWSLENGEEPLTVLNETINKMTVDIETIDRGIFTMYCGELMYVDDLPSHYDWITVSGSASCDGGGTCNYTVTVNWEGEEAAQRRLVELGAKLPAGYSYQEGSAVDFLTNITGDEPDETGEAPDGAQWIKWTWSPGHGPMISSENATQTQEFRIVGSGNIEGDYTWVAAQSQDIGLVGEITGTRYRIISTARESINGRKTAVLTVDMILVGGSVYVMSWQVTG